MTTPSETLDPDTAFALLSNGRRRRLLRELDRVETASLRDVARRVAATEQGTTAADVGSRASKSVYVSLYQTHVPRLADRDVVRYDAETKTVSLVRGPTTRRLLRMLDEGPSLGRYYTVAALVGAALAVVTLAAGGPEVAWRVVAAAAGVAVAGITAIGGRSYVDRLGTLRPASTHRPSVAANGGTSDPAKPDPDSDPGRGQGEGSESEPITNDGGGSRGQ